MKVLIYCQHVLGIGHLFRTLQIAKALEENEVTLVLGGPPASVFIPDNIRVFQLPGLQMDADFSEITPVESGLDLEEVKKERTKILLDLAKQLRPDAAIIELFPFGRNGFAFELIPLLEALHCINSSCRIVCSLRDILVEKSNQEKFEQRVLDRLNTYFDALFIHGDPGVISLDKTFSQMDTIAVPVRYTGYICENSSPAEGNEIRELIRLNPDEKLIVVSAGGGNVGYKLLSAALRAYDRLEFAATMQIFSGPYLDPNEFAALKEKVVPGIRLEQFTTNFPAWLQAADLSISMGGYNTTMNTLTAGTPALILPFSQNREQRMRAEKLSTLAAIKVLDEQKLSPGYLAESIAAMITKQKTVPQILLDGAVTTNNILTQWVNTGTLS